MHRKETEDGEKEMVILGSARPFDGQDVKELVGCATEIAEPRECSQRERKTCPHGLYFTRVFRGDEVIECAVLKELNLTAWDVLSRRASNRKLDELGKQARSDLAELARSIAELKKKLEAAEQKLRGLVQVCEETVKA